MKESARQNYQNRLNKVFEFIDHNLTENLSLEILAAVAHLSPFHFHRIFRHITGEALNEYITRQRVEKAAGWIIHRKQLKITDIAFQCGFSSNSSFTRAFRKFYGIAPSHLREEHQQHFSKIGQESPNYEKYLCAINDLKTWLTMNASIEIKELPAMQFAYISTMGPQNVEHAFNHLIEWASPHGLLDGAQVRFLTVYHDSFKITAPEKVRLSAGIRLTSPLQASGEVGISHIPKGKYLSGRFLITANEFESAWTSLFIWMNENGYQKADKDPFEWYHNNFREHPENKFDVELFIPLM